MEAFFFAVSAHDRYRFNTEQCICTFVLKYFHFAIL